MTVSVGWSCGFKPMTTSIRSLISCVPGSSNHAVNDNPTAPGLMEPVRGPIVTVSIGPSCTLAIVTDGGPPVVGVNSTANASAAPSGTGIRVARTPPGIKRPAITLDFASFSPPYAS
jgi:hypothetical protein